MAPTYPALIVPPTEPRVVAGIPALPGSYVLVFALEQPLGLEVGRLGVVDLAPGRYVYFGSAWGSGGLRARIRRHVRPDKSPHWHIDYLTRQVQPVFVHWQPEVPDFKCARGTSLPEDVTRQKAAASDNCPVLPHARAHRLECTWCQRIAQCAGVGVPVHHFGSSDCRTGCQAHLLRLPADMTIQHMLGELT